MNNLLRTFAEISVSCSAVILLAAFLDKLTYKKYSVRWKYYIWVILAVRMILPFNLGIIEVPLLPPSAQTELTDNGNGYDLTSGNMTAVRPDPETGIQNGAMASEVLNTVGRANIKTEQPGLTTREDIKLPLIKNNGIDILRLLSMLWISGFGIFLFYHVFTYIVFLKKLNRWMMPAVQEETREIMDDLMAELKIRKKIKVMVCKFVSSPMLLGILQPKIILPSEEQKPVRIRIILKHELIHYRHQDLYIKFLFLLVNAIHWFNPFVYYMVKSANNDMEIYCDEDVIGKQNEEYRRIYSLTILETITKRSADKLIAFSTYFYGGKKQMKNRFSQIMNGAPKKKGLAFFAALLCFIILTGSLAACGEKNRNVQSPGDLSTDLSQGEQAAEPEESEPADTSRILLVGIDGSGGTADKHMADSIILATIRPELKTITLASYLRDTYVEIPGEGKNKLKASYDIGGTELLKRTLETNFDLSIDGAVVVDYGGFERIVNLLGGVEMELTEEEAAHLNKTNFISEPENRTLTAGNQILNGNQALGYLRTRYVENADGLANDFGRTARQRLLLKKCYEKFKISDPKVLLSILDTSITYVKTDLGKKQIITYVSDALETDYTFETLQIPAEGTYEAAVADGMSVLVPDMTANKEK